MYTITDITVLVDDRWVPSRAASWQQLVKSRAVCTVRWIFAECVVRGKQNTAECQPIVLTPWQPLLINAMCSLSSYRVQNVGVTSRFQLVTGIVSTAITVCQAVSNYH